MSRRRVFDLEMAAALELDAKLLRRKGSFDSARFAVEAAHAYRSGWAHLFRMSTFRGLDLDGDHLTNLARGLS